MKTFTILLRIIKLILTFLSPILALAIFILTFLGMKEQADFMNEMLSKFIHNSKLFLIPNETSNINESENTHENEDNQTLENLLKYLKNPYVVGSVTIIGGVVIWWFKGDELKDLIFEGGSAILLALTGLLGLGSNDSGNEDNSSSHNSVASEPSSPTVTDKTITLASEKPEAERLISQQNSLNSETSNTLVNPSVSNENALMSPPETIKYIRIKTNSLSVPESLHAPLSPDTLPTVSPETIASSSIPSSPSNTPGVGD